MPLDNFVENLEKEGNNKRKIKPKKPAEKGLADTGTGGKKEDNSVFSLIIAVVVILGIIGLVFGYTRDKIMEIKKGGNDITAGLEQQVSDLKSQLQGLQEKANELEKQSLSNKTVVLDLFEKLRRLPDKVNTASWSTLSDDALGFNLSFPSSWERVKAVVEQPAGSEVVYLQPIGQADFLNAVTIKGDYIDFAKLSLKEKKAIFEDLEQLDQKDFDGGQMIYFINLEKDNVEVPTILVLTGKNIYRATFNIANKKLDNYFEYRKNFEEIISTFAAIAKKK